MKKLFLILLVTFAIPSFVNAQTAVTGREASKNKAEFKVKTFSIAKMVKNLLKINFLVKKIYTLSMQI